MSERVLEVLQAEAEQDGRECVVGALICNQTGEVFVHRRGWDRILFPGCWDIVGGHVDPGETLLQALAREVEEETGWTVVSCQLLYVGDWDAREDGRLRRRREFDFRVAVAGDLARPRLEQPKHVEYRWLSDDLSLLDENRGEEDGYVRHVVAQALRSANPGALSFPHAFAFLQEGAATQVEAARARWDPAMAWQIAAHLTLAYPQEASLEQLLDRLSRTAPSALPVPLRLGSVGHWGHPKDGVFIEVEDLEGRWEKLRRLVAGPRVLAVAPHVTVVHPRTTNRGLSAWQELSQRAFNAELTVTQIAVTAFNGSQWEIVQRFPLGTPPA